MTTRGAEAESLALRVKVTGDLYAEAFNNKNRAEERLVTAKWEFSEAVRLLQNFARTGPDDAT